MDAEPISVRIARAKMDAAGLAICKNGCYHDAEDVDKPGWQTVRFPDIPDDYLTPAASFALLAELVAAKGNRIRIEKALIDDVEEFVITGFGQMLMVHSSTLAEAIALAWIAPFPVVRKSPLLSNLL